MHVVQGNFVHGKSFNTVDQSKSRQKSNFPEYFSHLFFWKILTMSLIFHTPIILASRVCKSTCF